MKKVIILIIIIFALGYLFKDETACINIHDTYYVATYLTIAIYIIYLLVALLIVELIVEEWRKKKVR